MTSVTIDLNELIAGYDEEGPHSLRDEVVRTAKSDLIELVKRESLKAVVEEIKSTVESQIREHVTSMLANIMNEPLFATDSYGNRKPNASPQTIHEIVLEAAHKHLATKVDSGGRDQNQYHEGPTRMAWLAQKAATDMVQKEFKAEIDAAAAELRKSLQGKLSAAFQSAFKEAVK